MACGACAERRRRAYEALRSGQAKELVRQAAKGVRQMVTGPTEADKNELGLEDDGPELNTDPS